MFDKVHLLDLSKKRISVKYIPIKKIFTLALNLKVTFKTLLNKTMKFYLKNEINAKSNYLQSSYTNFKFNWEF